MLRIISARAECRLLDDLLGCSSRHAHTSTGPLLLEAELGEVRLVCTSAIALDPCLVHACRVGRRTLIVHTFTALGRAPIRRCVIRCQQVILFLLVCSGPLAPSLSCLFLHTGHQRIRRDI